jgi:Zn-dependent protease
VDLSALPLVFILIALLGFRFRVSPRASVLVRAPIERVFGVLDLKDGDEQRWHRARVKVSLIDPASQTFRIRYASTLSTGAERVSTADFRVVERQMPSRIVLDRAGLEGRSHNNELLRIEGDFAPEGEGTRFNLAYHWGPRPLIAQLLARTELYGGIHRFKSVAETGEPNFRAETLISFAVALTTGAITFAGFGWWFGWTAAVILILALFVHEFGHLLAFRMLGQPWGRMVFLPFLGALAVPRLAFESQAQSVFSALMGPGFSLVLPLLAIIAWFNDAAHASWLAQVAIVSAALNLFNLLPVEPLDGGVAIRAMLSRILGGYTHYAMMAVGALVIWIGWQTGLMVIAAFGAVAVLVNLRPRPAPAGLRPLSGAEQLASFAGFLSIAAAHALSIGFILINRH